MFTNHLTKFYGKALVLAVLGGAGLLVPATAKADGFRIGFGIGVRHAPAVIVQQPVVVAQPVYAAPTYYTPVYQPVYQPAPVCQPAPVVVEQPVVVTEPVCAPPVIIRDRDDWRWHRGQIERYDRDHRGHDSGFRGGR